MSSCRLHALHVKLLQSQLLVELGQLRGVQEGLRVDAKPQLVHDNVESELINVFPLPLNTIGVDSAI